MRRHLAACVVVGIVCHSAWAETAKRVGVSGQVKRPDEAHGKGTHFRLTGDAAFGWQRGPITGDLDINTHTFTMETGGGNRTIFTGVISGTGQFVWNGGGNARWQTVPSFLKGDKANTFSGTLTIKRGTLALAKPPGTAAHAGKLLVLGGGSNQAIVRLDAANQIADSCSIVILGKHEGRIWTQGHSETVGALTLQAHGYIDLGEGASRLAFADSSAAKWDLAKTLTVRNWTEGKDAVVFGKGAGGLTADQLKRIGFADPSGRRPGLYTARRLADGQIVPNARVEAVKPPFDVSDKAQAARRKVYDVPGRANLTGAATRLKAGMRISLFGDSITWQNRYIGAIDKAIKAAPGTKDLAVKLINRGINGGGVLSIRDGSPKSAYVSPSQRSGSQAPFAKVIASDKATVAVIFIGINDVWWRKTKPADFEKALRDIVAQARANKTIPVLATLTVYQEKPDRTNPKDAKCDQYAEITRKVARTTGSTLVDLRAVVMAYLQNHNAELRVDGTLKFVKAGVLTYDGVHPTARGNDLLADHIAQGIHEALKP